MDVIMKVICTICNENEVEQARIELLDSEICSHCAKIINPPKIRANITEDQIYLVNPSHFEHYSGIKVADANDKTNEAERD